MCTAVNFSNRILYSTFLRLIACYEIIGSATDPPCTHYVDYNRDTTAAAAIPGDFKARFRIRDPVSLQCMLSSNGDAMD